MDRSVDAAEGQRGTRSEVGQRSTVYRVGDQDEAAQQRGLADARAAGHDDRVAEVRRTVDPPAQLPQCARPAREVGAAVGGALQPAAAGAEVAEEFLPAPTSLGGESGALLGQVDSLVRGVRCIAGVGQEVEALAAGQSAPGGVLKGAEEVIDAINDLFEVELGLTVAAEGGVVQGGPQCVREGPVLGEFLRARRRDDRERGEGTGIRVPRGDQLGGKPAHDVDAALTGVAGVHDQQQPGQTGLRDQSDEVVGGEGGALEPVRATVAAEQVMPLVDGAPIAVTAEVQGEGAVAPVAVGGPVGQERT